MQDRRLLPSASCLLARSRPAAGAGPSASRPSGSGGRGGAVVPVRHPAAGLPGGPFRRVPAGLTGAAPTPASAILHLLPRQTGTNNPIDGPKVQDRSSGSSPGVQGEASLLRGRAASAMSDGRPRRPIGCEAPSFSSRKSLNASARVGLARDVGTDVAERTLVLLLERRAQLVVDVGGDDLCALGDEEFCRAATDAARRARDHRALALQPIRHGFCPSVRPPLTFRPSAGQWHPLIGCWGRVDHAGRTASPALRVPARQPVGAGTGPGRRAVACR
ncbi:hypothetical protein JD77_00859 [Micromonospora olivasterospora]|uniref:Uncharacterized protein n=1 Tax=Micromonospora olivasterospora TaxID=1880 RepID=A0A562I581_MICOL|nr:hypothetical protein JD77_00859 [Micromonospora olivasterospora]